MDPFVLYHVPHSSRRIPTEILSEFLIDARDLEREVVATTDHFTDELFLGPRRDKPCAIFDVSRLVLDPERFPDDALEPMASIGMGMIYTATADGRKLRHAPIGSARSALIERYYRPHILNLVRAIQRARETCGACLIIDCHSFPSKALPYELDQRRERPEICIGTDSFHTPDWLSEIAYFQFRKAGFDVALNRPFSGTLVPVPFYRRISSVYSMMIEVRRDLYLEESTAAKRSDFVEFGARLRRVVEYIARSARAMAFQTAGQRV